MGAEGGDVKGRARREGGGLGEIPGRTELFQLEHVETGSGVAGQVVDGSAAIAEIGRHQRRHFRRPRGDALRRDAVVASEDQTLHMVEGGWRAVLPARQPDDEFFEPPEAARWLGQPGVPLVDASGGVRIRRTRGKAGEAKSFGIGKGRVGHEQGHAASGGGGQ